MNKVGKQVFSWSIRSQLMILVLVAIVPALVIILINGFELKDSKIREAHERSLSAAKNLATEQEQITNSTRQILNTLARIPQVQKGDATSCDTIFRDLVSQNPAYLIFSIATPSGIVFASSHPHKHYSVADRRFFQDAMRNGNFSVGEYVVSRATNLPTLHFAYPIKTKTGRIQAVLVATLNLNVYRRFLSDEFYGDGYVMGITDRKGIRLYRYPDTGSDLTGVGIVVSDLTLRNLFSPHEEGTYEGVGSDGTYRFYAYKKLRLDTTSSPYGYVFVGANKDTILADANRELNRNLILLGLAMLLAFASAWGLGNISFVNRLRKLTDASRRLAEGDLQARTGLLSGTDEISRLAQSFDDMSHALERKDTERNHAEEEVRESQRRLSEIIEFLPDATLVIDPEGKVIAWNRAIETMTGVKAEEMLGKGNYEYALPFYGGRRPILIDLVLHWDSGQERDYVAIRKNGDILFGEAYTPNLPLGNRYLSATASILRNADGEVTAAIECIRDNTERKLLEEKLVRSEREYRNLVDNTPGGVFQTHLDGRILFANQEFANILHYDSIEELMARNVGQLYKNPEHRDAFLDTIQKSGTVKNYEIELVAKDGVTRDIMLSALMEGDLITGTFADITERKWAHDELKKYSEEISDLYDHAPCGYHSLDADGTFLRINNTQLNWLGYSRDDLIGRKKFSDLMTPESSHFFQRILSRLQSEGSDQGCGISTGPQRRHDTAGDSECHGAKGQRRQFSSEPGKPL